jgi:ABC-type transporter Mla subunit MlaD
MPGASYRAMIARASSLVAIVIAVVAVGVVLFGGGSGYVVHAEFTDAGQLVSGIW